MWAWWIWTENRFKGARGDAIRLDPLTRSIISVIVLNNRENIQSPARYVANEEFHHTGIRLQAWLARSFAA